MIKVLSPEVPNSQWEEIAKLNSFQAPFFTQAWHRLWFEVFGQNCRPLTLLIGRAVIAPLVRQKDLATFSGGREIADYLDIIGPDQRKVSAWQELIEYFRNNGIKQLELFNVPETSATITFFKRLMKSNPRIKIEREDTTPIISLPNSWNKYLTGLDRHNRHELRRKMKHFEKENPHLAFVESRFPKEEIEDLFKLMVLDSRKKAFLTSDMKKFFKRLPQVFPRETALFFLKLGNQKVASLLTFRVGRSLLTYNSGYNQNKFSGAGLYLKAMTIKWAIEKGFKKYNFLQGSERYKYDLGAKDFGVYSIGGTF